MPQSQQLFVKDALKPEPSQFKLVQDEKVAKKDKEIDDLKARIEELEKPKPRRVVLKSDAKPGSIVAPEKIRLPPGKMMMKRDYDKLTTVSTSSSEEKIPEEKHTPDADVDSVDSVDFADAVDEDLKEKLLAVLTRIEKHLANEENDESMRTRNALVEVRKAAETTHHKALNGKLKDIEAQLEYREMALPIFEKLKTRDKRHAETEDKIVELGNDILEKIYHQEQQMNAQAGGRRNSGQSITRSALNAFAGGLRQLAI
jgi:hypothetical protein